MLCCFFLRQEVESLKKNVKTIFLQELHASHITRELHIKLAICESWMRFVTR